MNLHRIDLTTALRPNLLPDETLLFVQDSVGLYRGKLKLPEYQHGHAYLTSHRACYIDNEEPRSKAVAVDLKDVEYCDLYAGFLKSSPKITIYPKASKRIPTSIRNVPTSSNIDPRDPYSSKPYTQGSPLRSSFGPRTASPVNATWICPICSYANAVPSNFDPAVANASTPLPACLNCGIKPPLVHIVKAAIANLSNRQSHPETESSGSQRDPYISTQQETNESSGFLSESSVQCPRCTFENHSSLLHCEICGAALPSSSAKSTKLVADYSVRSDSPDLLAGDLSSNVDSGEMKFSFRAGGEKIFLERLKSALIQRKWLLQGAPPIPKGEMSPSMDGRDSPKQVQSNIGIAGLERRGLDIRKNNEVVIGNAFEDLEALMASAKEIIALAETFASQTGTAPQTNGGDSTSETSNLFSQLSLTTTKEMLHPSSTSNASDSLYLTELARSIAEFLTDDATGVLRREGDIISLVDLWAVFNRARGGVELVSPHDFGAAAELFEKLKLPVRLRRFRSGLLVVQGRERTDEKTVATIMEWIRQMREVPPEMITEEGRRIEVNWDWRQWGRGVTAQETAERFGWSVGVATEELEMAEEKGALCREMGLEGVRFWENWLIVSEEKIAHAA